MKGKPAGAGVHAMDGSQPDASFTFSGDQTVLRAELAAIQFALERAQDNDKHVVIATDSLTSLQLVNKGIHAPHKMTTHRHCGLLTAVVRTLKIRNSAGLETTLQKVRAHVGVDGNEKADKLAKGATEGTTLTEADEYQTPDENIPGFTWMKMGADNKLSAIKDGPELFNVAQAVRIAQLVADKPKSRAAKWAARSASDGLMGDASNKFRHLPGIKRATRNAVIRVRADRFIGNAILKLWGKATSSACPHCHRGYDNGFHVVSNCGNSQMRGTLTVTTKQMHMKF